MKSDLRYVLNKWKEEFELIYKTDIQQWDDMFVINRKHM